MPPPISLTHISTASVLLHLGPLTFITDPVFDSINTTYPVPSSAIVLQKLHSPALRLSDLPHIDAVLLSHEDHADNLDPSGRILLNGRRVFTTSAGKEALAPRPSVFSLDPWEIINAKFPGVEDLKIEGTPCQHLPGGEVTGFLLSSPSLLGVDGDTSKPNAIYLSGDTVYLPELAKMKEEYHIKLAIVNVGDVHIAPMGKEPVKITMDGSDVVQLCKEIDAEVVVPVHYEGWKHFSTEVEKMRTQINEGLGAKVHWVLPGVNTRVL